MTPKANSTHIRLNVNMPFPAIFDRMIHSLVVVPKNYVEKVGDEGFAAKPVGAGPFKLIEFERDVRCKVEAVADHYRQPPYVKTLTYSSVPESGTRLAMLKTGEADLIWVDSALIPAVQADPKLQIIWIRESQGFSMGFCDMMHPEDSPFKDIRVRQATMLAIDKEKICHEVAHDAYVPAGDVLASYEPGYNPNIKPIPYDPAKARQLLAEAGYPKGFDTVFNLAPERAKTEWEPVIAQLAEVGIRCKVESYEWGAWSKNYSGKAFRGLTHCFGPSHYGRAHPAVALQSAFGDHYWAVLATDKDKEAVVAINYAIGNEAIAKAARKAADLILEEYQMVPIWTQQVPVGLGPRVESYYPKPGRPQLTRFETIKLKD